MDTGDTQSKFAEWDKANYSTKDYIEKIEAEFNSIMVIVNNQEKYDELKKEDNPVYMYYGYAYGYRKVQLQKTENSTSTVTNGTEEQIYREMKKNNDKLQELLKDDEKKYDTGAIGEIRDAQNELLKKISKDSLFYTGAKQYKDAAQTAYENAMKPKDEEHNLNGDYGNSDSQVYKNALLGESSASSSHTIDEVIDEAQGFIQKGDSEKIDTSELKKASDTLYNILLAIGVITTVIVGLYLAIKYMVSSLEEQAKIKESIIPYIVGCVVIYGAFIIWKLAILLLRGIS